VGPGSRIHLSFRVDSVLPGGHFLKKKHQGARAPARYRKGQQETNRVFGWRAGRAGSERTHFRGCLVGGWEGWVGSRVEYSSQMRVGPVRQNLADGAALARLAPTKH
jgi:hypothetical protein